MFLSNEAVAWRPKKEMRPTNYRVEYDDIRQLALCSPWFLKYSLNHSFAIPWFHNDQASFEAVYIDRGRKILQSWPKIVRKMDVTLPSFKIELLKALTTTNTSPPPQKNNVEVRLDPFWPRLNNFDQGGARVRAIAVPNPRDRLSVGTKVQNSLHFWSKIVAQGTS